MNTLQNKATTLLGVAMLITFGGITAHADDTEIFELVPTSTTNAQHNILLIMDTSGSMVDNSVTQAMDYDPITPYAKKNSCEANRIYWKSGNDSVSCGNNYVTTSAMKCKTALDKIQSLGYHAIGNVAQWNKGTKQWGNIVSGTNGQPVECFADVAINHGEADNDGKLPRAGSQGPYTTNAAQSISLEGQGSYTFYSGNYLNYVANAGNDNLVTLTRLEVVKSVARRFLDGLSNVNVGIMRFQNKGTSTLTEGGYVVHEFVPVDTHREQLKQVITDLNGNSYTPLSETMYEASLYWKGATPEFGNNSSGNSYSVDASRVSTGGKYKSPILNSCANNFNVLLTDGDPTQDKSADSEIEKLIGSKCSENGGSGSASGQNKGDGRCLDDIAGYMYKNDMMPPASASTNDPKDVVRTYVIGFGTGITDQSILGSTAKEGGGKAYVATDTITLTEAFTDIAREVVDASVSFTSPTVAVNAFNRTQNLNDLFITTFSPSKTYHWPGNLKKYRLKADGSIVDSEAKAAVDPNTGFFAKGAKSFWSATVDGAIVTEGGAAKKVPALADRLVFTDLNGSVLTNAKNAISVSNKANLPNTTLGLAAGDADAIKEAHIKWILGADVDDDDEDSNLDEPRFSMGDPLHAKPATVIYGGDATNPTGVIYASTNDGFLHAIDPDNGVELWSYIPSELLPRTKALRDNLDSAVKRYGLDGNIRAHKIDRNNNGIVDTGDKVYLFFGMGRGGDEYFALDVTDKTKPELLWKKSFVGAGQSWSTPVVTRVNVSGATQNADKLVLIMGGGYDDTQDNVAYNTDDKGNRLYIVDAVSGALLWHAGPTNVTGLGYEATANFTHAKLTNSIPSDIRVVDMTGDGFADRMYVADTGARIWRFDIHNGKSAGTASSSGGSSAGSLVTGGVLASLGHADGVGNNITDARRFFNAPDVSLITDGGNTFVNISIGSGHRGSPKNEQIEDRFYSVRDFKPFLQIVQADYNDATKFPTITDAALIDLTSKPNETLLANATGWKIRLSKGEKSLAEARTFEGSILFTTYKPTAGTVVNACRSTAGKNSLYAVKALNAAPHADRDTDGSMESEDRSGDLGQGGLAPEPVIIFPSPDDPNNCGSNCSPPPACKVGVEACGVSFGNAPVKTFWRQDGAE